MAIAPAPPGRDGGVVARAATTQAVAATTPLSAPRRPRGPRSATIGGVLLVAAGLVMLASNLLPVSAGPLMGALILGGLGAVFAAARYSTGRYGYAVPAGILLALGAFVFLQDAGVLPGNEGSWFFLLLGLGFAAIYPLGGQLGRVWPLYPATILIALGLVGMLLPVGIDLASYVWVGNYWPLILVAIGLWLLARSYLPPFAGRVLGIVLTVGLIAYIGIVSAAVGSLYEPGFAGPRPEVPAVLSPFMETRQLSSSIMPTDTLRISNPAGNVSVRPGGADQVRVEVVAWGLTGNRPEPRLRATDGALVLDQLGPGGSATSQGRLDYIVEVPATTQVEVQTASGGVDVRGLTGSFQVNTASGGVRISLPGGAVNARVRTTSGDVDARYAPSSSALVLLRTVSGDIRVDRPEVQRSTTPGQQTATLTLGSGVGGLEVQTVSGGIRLREER